MDLGELGTSGWLNSKQRLIVFQPGLEEILLEDSWPLLQSMPSMSLTCSAARNWKSSASNTKWDSCKPQTQLLQSKWKSYKIKMRICRIRWLNLIINFSRYY